jgi:outer membrane protein
MRNTVRLAALVVALAAAFPVMAQVAEGNWLVRARAVNLDFRNGQADGLNKGAIPKVEAQNTWIPEFDVSYFFTKNIAAELVLTWPQKIDIEANGSDIGSVKALPPSLLIQYHFTDLGAFKPYVGVGVNYTIFSDRKVANKTLHVSDDSWGLAAQVGLDYALSKNWSLNADIKYVQMSTDVIVNATGQKLGKVNLDPMLYGIGIGYRF